MLFYLVFSMWQWHWPWLCLVFPQTPLETNLSSVRLRKEYSPMAEGRRVWSLLTQTSCHSPGHCAVTQGISSPPPPKVTKGGLRGAEPILGSSYHCYLLHTTSDSLGEPSFNTSCFTQHSDAL
jgi:hypothetical protein